MKQIAISRSKEKHVCDVHMSCSKGKLNFYKFIQASPHIQVLFENQVLRHTYHGTNSPALPFQPIHNSSTCNALLIKYNTMKNHQKCQKFNDIEENPSRRKLTDASFKDGIR